MCSAERTRCASLFMFSWTLHLSEQLTWHVSSQVQHTRQTGNESAVMEFTFIVDQFFIQVLGRVQTSWLGISQCQSTPALALTYAGVARSMNAHTDTHLNIIYLHFCVPYTFLLDTHIMWKILKLAGLFSPLIYSLRTQKRSLLIFQELQIVKTVKNKQFNALEWFVTKMFDCIFQLALFKLVRQEFPLFLNVFFIEREFR